jgi:tetratricopeptide (TPR) repeat protein
VSTTVAEARELLKQGRIVEAERVYERVLDASPNDVEALNMVALAEQRQGRIPKALELLNRAVQAGPTDALTRHNLARVQEAMGDHATAIASWQAAVQLQADFFLARLHLAFALERSGQTQPALIQYSRALKDAQERGRWTNASTTPAGLRQLVERAVYTVRTGRRALFLGLLQPMIQKYGRESMTRVEQALRIYLGEQPGGSSDPRQAPTFLFFPGLPPAAYLDRSLFPWIPELEAQTAAIGGELATLLPSSGGRERVFTSDALEQENLRGGLDIPPSWNGYYFYRHGIRREDNCTACPITANALDQLPLCRVPGHGPEVLYSVFTPGTHLLPHKGVTNTRLVGHLPLMIPPDCALNVGGEIHVWEYGRVVVFDDTYEHEAWNRSHQTRVVLIFDLWNPYLTEAERAALVDLVPAIGKFRESMETA